MREILFRGKCIETGEWVFGFLERRPSPIQMPGYGGAWYIYVPPRDPDDNGGYYNVNPETIGQYTGLIDRNGQRIFEGDVVNLHYFFEALSPGTYGVYEDEKTIIARIEIREYGIFFKGRKEEDYLSQYIQEPEEELEVIGNIFDNPELLREV